MSDAAMQPAPATGLRVAFQGELGAFSEEAVHRFFGEGVQPVPQREFTEVGSAVVSQEVDFGVLPIENSLAGSVVASYDVLSTGDLKIVGEVITPIHHCVLGMPGASLDRLRRIFSHPVALMQCTRFLRSVPHIEAVAVYDTAGAAKDVASQQDPGNAAIAAARAADRYNLDILVENVEDRTDNQTRFLVVARPGVHLPDGLGGGEGVRKTAVIVETHNVPGALLKVLSPFSSRNINLSKLESRPAGQPWSYRFFLEMDADLDDENARQALDEVGRSAEKIEVLGTYPKWE